MATIGTILIQASNQAANLGVGSGQGSMSDSSSAAKDRRDQAASRKNIAEQTDQGKQAPKFWTAAFKKMGIQMGLSGLLKQSQIFTSTVGSLFQLLGAFVDVILAPFVPIMIPAMRWLARQLPTVSKGMKVIADKIFKAVGAVWNWLFKGGIKKSFGELKNWFIEKWNWFKGDQGFGKFIDFFKDIGGSIASGVEKAAVAVEEVVLGWAHTIYEKTIGKLKIPNPFAGHFGIPEGANWFEMPTWVRESKPPTTTTDARNPIPTATVGPVPPPTNGGKGGLNPNLPYTPPLVDDLIGAGADAAAGAAQDGVEKVLEEVKGKSPEEILKFLGIGVGGTYVAARTVQGLTATVKIRDVLDFLLGPTNQGKALGMNRATLRTALKFLDPIQLNPARAFPGSDIVHDAAERVGNKLRLPSRVRDLMRFLGPTNQGKAFETLTDAQRLAASKIVKQPPSGLVPKTPKTPVGGRVPPVDDLKPTQLSNAVNKFNAWVNEAGRGLRRGAGAGADAFKRVYDKGLSLADDVVRIAGRTRGFGFVGQMVSTGFKRVIPGIGGAYMVGETISDIMKIINAKDVPWIGDWKDIDSYTSEAMGTLFAEGHGPLQAGQGLLGTPLKWIGKTQSALGFGSSISDWQDALTKAQQEGGLLASGKLMDLITRGITGFGGAALQTFFPGLGTLAGTALYEGGRYATTGLKIPGIEGTVGGNVERYGEAQDFSELLIKAIETGWSEGVGNITGQP